MATREELVAARQARLDGTRARNMARNAGQVLPPLGLASELGNLEYLASLDALQEQQQATAMQRSLDAGAGRYYDKVPGTGGEIQISLGDVVDINKQGMPPVNADRVINGKAYLPPPAIENVNHMQTEYTLNDAGRNAQAQLAGKLPIPQIPQGMLEQAMQNGGTYNPSTGAVSFRAPQASRGLSMSDPRVRALDRRDQAAVEDGLADPQTSFNDYQTSLSMLAQTPPQAQGGTMPAPAQPSLTVKQYMQPGEQVIAEDRDAAEVQGADGRTYVIIKATGERIAV